MTTATEQNTMSWYLKTADGSVFGPVEFPVLQDWAAQGRVAPGDQVSQDQKLWVPGETVPGLGLEWMVEVLDNSVYGPVHISAIKDLVTDGGVTLEARVTNLVSGAVTSVQQILADLSCLLYTSPSPRD